MAHEGPEQPPAVDGRPDPEAARELSRRSLFRAGGLSAVGLALPRALWLPASASELTRDSFYGRTPLRLAMHVHGSWSEGYGSWEAQFAQAVRNGIDVLYMTDHDIRATARGYRTSLYGVGWVRTSSGPLARHAASALGGAVHLVAESASATRAASVTMTIPDREARQRLRTSIAGQTLVQRITSAHLTGGARYEIVVPLSLHPAGPGRPAARFELIYRFGGHVRRRYVGPDGRHGIVVLPTPAAGSVQRLRPEADVAALWPTMLAMDNVLYGNSVRVESPRRGAVANVRVASIHFVRSENAPSDVRTNQAHLVATYQPRFPSLTVRRSTEISREVPDMNPFGVGQYFPNYARLSSDHDTRYRQIVSAVHSSGGLISWNHPFGYGHGPLLDWAGQVRRRHRVFAEMWQVHEFAVDILEVGYTLRGHVSTRAHLDLWDTFSRAGRFLTGNGVTDDHLGRSWAARDNGFLTGVWAASRSTADVHAALAAGRAYVAHMGRWPGGTLDLLVDGVVPMGAVAVAPQGSRSMAILAAELPANSVVQLVAGPVDYTGARDPGTVVVRTLTPADFAGGVAQVRVDTSTSRFYRVQVLAVDGSIVGSSNPVWLLRSPPPHGIPVPRR